MPAFGGGGAGGGPFDVTIPPGERTGPTLPGSPAGGLPLALLLAMLQSQQQGDLHGRGPVTLADPGRPLFGPQGSNPISGALTPFLERRAPGYSQRVRDALTARDAASWGNYGTMMSRGATFDPSSALGRAYATPADVRNPMSPNYDWNAAQGAQFAGQVATGGEHPEAGRAATAERNSLIDALIQTMLEQQQNPAMGTGQ